MPVGKGGRQRTIFIFLEVRQFSNDLNDSFPFHNIFIFKILVLFTTFDKYISCKSDKILYNVVKYWSDSVI